MGRGKKKIEIKKKENAADRMVTFSKRKKGLFKKASQLNQMSGSQIAVLLFSPAGRPHTNAPLFDAAISRYLSSVVGDTDDATEDVGTSGRIEDDGSLGMFSISVEELLLGSIGGHGVGVDHAEGLRNRSVNNGSAGMWLNSVELGFLGEGRASTCDISAGETHCKIREWLNSIEVEGIERVEDLLLMKQRLESIREKVVKKVDDAICSYFV